MRFGSLHRRFLLAGAIGALALPGAASADTLREALVQAYGSNPSLTGARANQRAVDESVPIALSAGRPSLIGTGNYNENVRRSGSAFSSPRRFVGAALQFEMPIYQGGAVRNGVRAAESRVEAGRADLRSVEATLFTNVVAAYLDVISTRNIVELNANQVRVLDTNLQATSDRFEIGDLTRTDVAQAQARLMLARSALDTAEAQRDTAEERYLELVGSAPGMLEPPPPLPDLPPDPDRAEDIAVVENPNLVSAQRNAEAARSDIEVAEAARMPRLSAVASGNYTHYLGSLARIDGQDVSQSETSAVVGLSASMPIYQGGLPAAQVRQATARFGQAQERVVETERAVIADVRSSFSQYRAALEVIESSRIAVDANALALEGVRAENSVGLRTILDILNAEQELLNSQVDLVNARRDAYVAGFNLLASMGRAEAEDLGLDGGALYDPVQNYDRVRGIWWDWDDDPIPEVEATRTVDAPRIGPPAPVIPPPPSSTIPPPPSQSGVTTPSN